MSLFGGFNGYDSGLTGPQQIDFLSNGTWCCPAGIVCAKVYVIVAGGGGGGGAARCLSGPTPRVTAGGGGGGGGGVSVSTLSAACLCSSYCVVIGAGGLCGPRAAVNGDQGLPGGTGGDSCFGPLIAGGGGAGAGGCFAVTSSCVVVQGGAAGSGTTHIGQTGGCGRIQNGTGIGPTSPTAANGGRGGGGGCGTADYETGPAGGGSQIFLDGIRLGCGAEGQFNPVTPDPLGCPAANSYGAGGGGGGSTFYSGAQCPSTGGPGTKGFVRVISYF